MKSFSTSLFCVAAFAAILNAEWSQPVEVRHDDKVAVTYTAMLDGDLLVVKAAIEPGWHTFVMDNKQREREKLAGKPSLGIEKSTEINAEGLTVSGPWLQSTPKDFSKPELRYYSWGFEQNAIFAAKARRSGSGPARVELTGQACKADICKNIEISMTVSATKQSKAAKSGIDPKTLVAVR